LAVTEKPAVRASAMALLTRTDDFMLLPFKSIVVSIAKIVQTQSISPYKGKNVLKAR